MIRITNYINNYLISLLKMGKFLSSDFSLIKTIKENNNTNKLAIVKLDQNVVKCLIKML